MELIFTASAIDLIFYVAIEIHQDSRRQSERDMLDVGPFRHGFMYVKSLEAKERFSRVYCLFLALSNVCLIDEICKKKLKKGTINHKPFYFLENFLKIIIM